MATVDEEVRGRVYDVLEGRLAVGDFELWLAGETWDASSSALVARIDHLLVERTVRGNEDFLDALRGLIQTRLVVEFDGPISSSAGETHRLEPLSVGNQTFMHRWEPAGT